MVADRKKRMLVIGMDSLPPVVVEKFMSEGLLPSFSRLCDDSVSFGTINPPNLSETVWPNYFTASGPGHHGRYFNSQIVPGTYKTREFDNKTLRVDPYWRALSDAGRRVFIVDVPKSYALDGLNGVQVANWANHDQEKDAGFETWPIDYKRRLITDYGPDPVSPDDFGGNGPADQAVFADALVSNIKRKTRLLLDQMMTEGWDHGLFVYDDAHPVCHYAWHLHDPEHPDHNSELAATIGDPIKHTCLALDDALGQIMARLDASTQLLVFLSHGIGPAYHASYIVDEILRRFQGAPRARGKPVNYLRGLWRGIPVRFHDRLLALQNVARNMLLEPDRRRRMAFALPAADDAGAIRINLVGRERHGLVEPGQALDDYCDLLASQFRSVVNADTGNPIVADVVRVSDYCSGPQLDCLPDLIVKWVGSEPIRAVTAPGIGTVELPPRNSRKGSHTEAGMLSVYRQGQGPTRFPDPIRLIDIAPSLCAVHGVTLPQVEGHPVSALVDALN